LATGLINLAVAFPALLVAIFVAAIVGVGAHGAVAGIAVAIAPYYARLSQTLSSSVAGSEYLAAARMLGVRRVRLLTRHVLPNIAEPLLITSTISVGDALLSLAGLSFLGLGVQPPQYDWGRMLNEGLNRIYVNPEVALGPAVAITLGALTFALFGEVLAKAAGAGGARRWLRGELAEADAASVRAGVGSTEPAGRAGAGLAGAGATDLVLAVENLTVSFPGGAVPVRDVSLRIEPGEIVGIVGESGSGKTLTAMAIADLLPAAAHLSASRLCLFGEDPRALSTSQRRRLLGRSLAVVYQDPMSALNPALRVGRQVGEVAEVHQGSSKREASTRAVERLRAVRIGSAEARARQYPHEFSGGMRQRAVIAMGLMAEPKLIVADEPTTALDVTVQQQILRLLRDVSVSRSAAAILISHDVAVVSQLCSRVVVMYAGRVVEELDVGTLVDGPAHPYTAALVAAVPTMASDRERPLASIPGRAPASHASRRGHRRGGGGLTRLEARGVTVRFGNGRRRLTAVDGVDLDLPEAATLGIVGESGSGKSTLARALVGLVPIASGDVFLDGDRLPTARDGRVVDRRRRIQMIFQDPFASLNPRMTVGEAIGEALTVRGGAGRGVRGAEVARHLDLVHLDPQLAERMPSGLSGGQRQRVAIARALAARPEVLIADEITSSLDVSV